MARIRSLHGLFVLACAIVLTLAVPARAQDDTPSGKPSAPLIFIPGLMGSALCDPEDDNTQVWGDALEMTTARGAFRKLRALDDDPAVGLQPCDVMRKRNVDIELVGTLFTPVAGSGYGELLTALEAMGYSEAGAGAGQPIHVFPYDWRRSNFQNAERLSKFIDSLELDGPVDILAHSMGGLVARIYLQTNDGQTPVRHLITMGTPHRGAAALIRSFVYPEFLSRNWWLPRQLILEWPSLLELAPRYARCCYEVRGQDDDQRNEVFDVLSENFWAYQNWFAGTFDQEGSPARQRFLQSLERARRLKGLLARTPEGVQLTHIASPFHDTPTLIRARRGFGKLDGVVDGPGDDTVPYDSARNGGRDEDAQTLDADHGHMTIFLGETAVRNIAHVLMNTPENPVTVTRELEINLSDYLPRMLTRGREIIVDLNIETIGLETAIDAWTQNAQGRAKVALTYQVRLSDDAQDFVEGSRRKSRALQEGIRRYIAERWQDSDYSVCIETDANPVCLAVEEVDYDQLDDTTRRVTATFAGTAPSRPGAYLLTVNQDFIKVGLSRPIYVAEAE